jgi:hypothetical protein
MDPKDPSKLFVQEIFQTVNVHMPWAAPSRSRLQTMTHKAWEGLTNREDSKE